ncbi:MAG TPA: xanthine dehydrogenase family protein subunit M [Terriglobales bacterium]|jgi:carbon-monoxide dehydrogenase medium subunit|nr:xanthine dehydrogenase family protein subunit M [Terriglobales bacterium]
MFPANFDYVAPKTLAEAVALVAQHGDGAKLLAGGHSLVPAMKLRLAQPRVLIDLGRVADLSYIREEAGQIRVGAMTTHYQLESSSLLRSRCPLLPETAAHIGDAQVRNKGTIGGSLAHADPAADWPAAILALGAEIVAVGPAGERVIAADKFIVDMLTTALRPGEIVREIRVPIPAPRTGHAYLKVRQPASGFAVVGVAATVTLAADGTCASAGVGITGVGPKPYRASAVEAKLKSSKLDAASVTAAAAEVAKGLDVNSDLYASAEYRAHLAQVYTRRAIHAATGRVR